jgi:hypothetical protein
MKAGIWDSDDMERRLNMHLAEYRNTSGHYRQIKRRAILIWISWIRKVRAGQEP